MNWTRFVAIVIGAGVVSSLTDWFFAGDWLHRRFTYPEVWRQGAEGRAIALSSPLPFLSCGVFAYLAARLGLHTVTSTLKLAIAVWLIGPLPLILHQCRVHEVAPSVCGVPRDRMAGEARDRCGRSWLVPLLMPIPDRLPPNARSVRAELTARCHASLRRGVCLHSCSRSGSWLA